MQMHLPERESGMMPGKAGTQQETLPEGESWKPESRAFPGTFVDPADRDEPLSCPNLNFLGLILK